jgi:hypothetical protein
METNSLLSGLGGGGGAGRTATSSAPTTISPVYGVSGVDLKWLVGGLAAIGGVFLLFTVFLLKGR